MTMAATLESYLQAHGVDYELVHHVHTGSSMESAEAAHIPGDALAKGVVLEDEDGYVLAVVPSDYQIEVNSLSTVLGRRLTLADEGEFKGLFPDCETGAVPAVGQAYGIRTLWDPEATLGRQERVFFEAGDHENLVALSGERFHELMAPAERAHFSHHI